MLLGSTCYASFAAASLSTCSTEPSLALFVPSMGPPGSVFVPRSKRRRGRRRRRFNSPGKP
eukprot:1929797-Pyramimonas_sp.AAC.1